MQQKQRTRLGQRRVLTDAAPAIPNTHSTDVKLAVDMRLAMYTSAPCNTMDLAASGNHWSQQMAAPITPKRVLKVMKPVSPGEK